MRPATSRPAVDLVLRVRWAKGQGEANDPESGAAPDLRGFADSPMPSPCPFAHRTRRSKSDGAGLEEHGLFRVEAGGRDASPAQRGAGQHHAVELVGPRSPGL